MAVINFLSSLHKSTSRNYVKRVVEHDKAECALVAKQWGEEYWDGDRKYGYGGYSYDGRWRPVATALIDHYNIKSYHKILDVGCGKGHLLFELKEVLSDTTIAGIDISEYGIFNAKREVRSNLKVGNCTQLPYLDNSFDFVYSLNTFHNLKIFDLRDAIREVERVSRGKAYICVESYRN